MKKYLIISASLLCLTHQSSFAQKSKVQIENERWLREFKKSERNWESADIKNLLESKLDESKALKSETEKWIIGKLNSYIPNEYTTEGLGYWDPVYNRTAHHYYTYNILSKRISFDNQYLTLSYSFKITSDSEKPEYKDWIDKIDISNLQNLTYDNEELTFWDFENSTTRVRFQFNKETDIGFRMKKAIVHLCSFYWKKVGNETF